MRRRDRVAEWLGIVLEEIAPGRARMTMRVRPEMVNTHGVCHGGLIFTLADTAFGYACNSHNLNTVAAGASIEFIAPARLGDALTAVAQERALTGRTGVYDVEVTDGQGRRIALFRGKSHRISGTVVPVEGGASPQE
ncbi:MAG TPA: hydroxyphenylacetyl-CoA thioesterase PaaI [Candidatus Dormibacteraeota bacterium]|nr:hydroxyphenylacetyl-CoA thioesterase PaaI [Candidatus Dormibacteraeota bacterium]